jgi:hypothetical protein
VDIALDALKLAVIHERMLETHDVASLAWTVRAARTRLKVLGRETAVTPYFFFAAHLFLCAAAILARPSALIVRRLAGCVPRFSGAV